MKKRLGSAMAILMIAALALGFVLPVAAQDSGTAGTMTNCDSSLMLLAGLAQRYFGFQSQSGLDLSTFESGQYSPLFQPSMGSDMSGTGSTGGDAGGTGTGSDAGGTGGTGTGSDASGTGGTSGDASGTGGTSGDASGTGGTTGQASNVFLNPPTVTGEDPFCTQLRADLESFFYNEIQMGDFDTRFQGTFSSGMSGSGTGSDSGSGSSG